jgi:hypothetical protein
MHDFFDTEEPDENSYTSYFGEDDKPLINTIRGPLKTHNQPSAHKNKPDSPKT